MRILRRSLAVLAGLVSLGWIVFFGTNGSAERPFVFDLAQVRKVAMADPHRAPPTEVRVERVATGTLPKLFVVSANTPFGSYPAVYASYQVRYVNGHSLIIDTAYDRASWQRIDGKLSVFDDASYARVTQAMKEALHIVVTHEHPDHLSGLAGQAGDATIMDHARLTPEQIDNAVASDTGFTTASIQAAKPFTYANVMQLLEPGVVLIKAPGHSPGSQLIYVYADGKELLFIGDIAWNTDSITRERTRPLIASNFLKEDRNAVAAQLNMLHDLQAANPNLIIVVAHDKTQLDANVASGAIKEGFVLKAATP